MSPLLFLAIAIVVPLLGMIVLGIGARIKHQQVTDDETEPFRRRLESIAPPETDDMPSSTPGLVRAMRRRRGGNPRREAPGNAAVASDEAEPAGRATAAMAGAEIAERRGRHRNRRAARQPAALVPARKPRAPTSIRLVERDYSLPLLPPISADLEELPQPAGEQRSRRAVPRPPGAERRHDRVNSADQNPDQRRRSGS